LVNFIEDAFVIGGALVGSLAAVEKDCDAFGDVFIGKAMLDCGNILLRCFDVGGP
jgi:uncharacterized membrane protein YeiH